MMAYKTSVANQEVKQELQKIRQMIEETIAPED